MAINERGEFVRDRSAEEAAEPSLPTTPVPRREPQASAESSRARYFWVGLLAGAAVGAGVLFWIAERPQPNSTPPPSVTTAAAFPASSARSEASAAPPDSAPLQTDPEPKSASHGSDPGSSSDSPDLAKAKRLCRELKLSEALHEC